MVFLQNTLCMVARFWKSGWRKSLTAFLHSKNFQIAWKKAWLFLFIKGKDPLLVSSYRGITLSSVLSKVLEIILLQRLSSPLEEQGFPDQLQTAYQKGVSCMDAIFATQETLTNHLRDGGQPYLCLFDIEKAFDSVELPILLQQSLQHWNQWEVVEANIELVHQLNKSRSCQQPTIRTFYCWKRGEARLSSLPHPLPDCNG